MVSKKEKNKESLFKIKFRNFFKNNQALISFLAVLLLITLAILVNHLKTNSENENKNLIFGDDVIDLNYFYLNTCPHCIEQEKFHEVLLEKYPNLRINKYELSSSVSRDKYGEFADKFNMSLDDIATPTTFIGDEHNVGFGSPQTTGERLIDMIEKENTRILSNWNSTTMKTTLEVRNTSEVVLK